MFQAYSSQRIVYTYVETYILIYYLKKINYGLNLFNSKGFSQCLVNFFPSIKVTIFHLFLFFIPVRTIYIYILVDYTWFRYMIQLL